MAGAFDAAPDGTAPAEPIIERPTVAPAKSNAAMDAQKKQTAAQQRLAELNKAGSPIWNKNHPEHAKSVAELKRLIAQEDTPTEREALVESGIEGARDLYGFDVPDDVPKYAHAEYAEQFEGHKQDLLLWSEAEAHAHRQRDMDPPAPRQRAVALPPAW